MGFPMTPNLTSQFDPFLSCEIYEKIVKNVIFNFQMIKLLWNFSDQQLPLAKLFEHMIDDDTDNTSISYYTPLQ